MNRELREKIKTIVKNSDYKDKINCVLDVLERTSINSWADLQNLPRLGHFCGIDVYQLLATLNENWDKDFSTPKRVKKVVTESTNNTEEQND